MSDKIEVTFSKVLGHKVSFMNPLFVVELNLKEPEVKGGSGSYNEARASGIFEYRNLVADEDVRLRLNYGLRRISNKGVLMMRKIFYDRNVWYNALEKYVDFDIAEDKTLDNDIKEMLGDIKIARDFTQCTDNRVVIRTHSYELDQKSKTFLDAWAELMYKISHRRHDLMTTSDINKQANEHGFRFVEQHTPRTTPDNNPLFVTYLLYEKM